MESYGSKQFPKSGYRVLPSRPLGIVVLLLSLAAISAVSLAAQSSRTSGTLEGTISDASGGVIPGVRVVLRQIETNQTRSVDTDDQGFFRATDLPVGTYEVRIEDPKFAPYLHTGVALDVGTAVHLDIMLQVAGITQQVTVSAQPPPIDSSQTSVTSAIDRDRIEDLPVLSRDALDFALLLPGVTGSSQGSNPKSRSILAGSGFSFGGLRPRSNNVSVDGLDNNDEYTGSNRIELSPEDVQEYQVVNNGLSAEYGGASGGSINVVTRTGRNIIFGDAYGYIQDAALNAEDPLETTPGKPSFRRYRVGSSMGGPVVKNRSFFHAALEQESNRGQIGSDMRSSLASAINNFLASGVFPRLNTRRITTGFSPIARAETEASGKLNYQLNSKNSLMLRYAFTNNRVAGNVFNTTSLDDASTRGSSFTSDNDLAGSLVSVFGSGDVGDLRFQVAARHAVLRSNQTAGPGIDIVGLIDFGQPYAGDSTRQEHQYQLSYTYIRTRGRQLWKLGGTVNHVGLRATVSDGFGGLYRFGSLADFMAGNPDSFRQVFGNPATNYAVTSYGAFAQDHVALLRRLTMDIGLRYDFEQLPTGFNESTHNFSPRIGLAFSPTSRWVVRAGFGIFFDREILANLNRAIEENGVNGLEQVANGNLAANLFRGASGGSLSSPAGNIAPSIFRSDPRLATPYSEQASLGAEYLIAPNITANVNYLFVRGVRLPRTVNINLVAPVVLTAQNANSLGVPTPTPQQIGRQVFGPGRVNPAFNDILWLKNSANSTYNGLSASVTQRMTKGLEFMGSYTLSKTLDDASDFDEQPQNPYDLHAERSASSQDQRQRFTFNSLWNLPIPGEIELVPLITVGTGRPVDPLVGLDSSRNDAYPLSVRPLGFGRNSLQTPRTVNVDFGVVKTIELGKERHVDLIAQFFNLFNHVSATASDPFFGSGVVALSGFGQSIQVITPRQIQFGVNLEY